MTTNYTNRFNSSHEQQVEPLEKTNHSEESVSLKDFHERRDAAELGQFFLAARR